MAALSALALVRGAPELRGPDFRAVAVRPAGASATAGAVDHV